MLAEGMIDLALGHGHSCALFEDGRVECWGHGSSGQLDIPEDLPPVLFVQRRRLDVQALGESRAAVSQSSFKSRTGYIEQPVRVPRHKSMYDPSAHSRAEVKCRFELDSVIDVDPFMLHIAASPGTKSINSATSNTCVTQSPSFLTHGK